MSKSWIYLIIAGLCEIIWAVGLKYSDGFSKILPSILTIIFAAISFVLLSLAMRQLPLGTAYAIWVGIGAVGTVIFGIIAFNEPVNLLKIFFVSLVIIGIVGLKLTKP